MNLIDRAALRWGRMIAGYGNSVTKNARILWEGRENIPSTSTIWFTFHDTNLVALALHDRVSPRRVQAFVPPGLVGMGMRGWFDGVGFEFLPLPAEGMGNPTFALKAMARGLSDNRDVVIAVDGPHGPARRVKPGAFWLGRRSSDADSWFRRQTIFPVSTLGPSPGAFAGSQDRRRLLRAGLSGSQTGAG